jgi:hypothetical protein
MNDTSNKTVGAAAPKPAARKCLSDERAPAGLRRYKIHGTRQTKRLGTLYVLAADRADAEAEYARQHGPATLHVVELPD